MKGLVLAGGLGSRLRPLTYSSAKQLVPVANKAILFYGLEAMAQVGIVEVGVVVGDTAADVMAAVGDGSAFGLKVTYLPQDEPLGLAHCVLIAREFLAEDDFVMYLGDNLLGDGLAPFLATEGGRHDQPAARILLARVSDPSSFGVAQLDADGGVIRLVEKPVDPPSDLALVGVYLFDARVHEAVRAIEPSARGELEITDAIQWLIDQGHPVHARQVSSWWIDTGKLTPLLEANRLVLERLDQRIDGSVDALSRIEGRVVIEPGAEVVRSTIRGPVAIGPRTRVTDSYVGPFTAIDADCEITASEVEHSVVMAGSSLVDLPRVADSLIGRFVRVARSSARPRATQLVLGDHSSVELG